MKDREFLIWIYTRLVEYYGENELYDYMHKFRAIIANTPKNRNTPNDGRGQNRLSELLEVIGDKK